MQPIGLLSNLKLFACSKRCQSRVNDISVACLAAHFEHLHFRTWKINVYSEKTEYIFGDFECVSCTILVYYSCCLSDVCHFGWKVHFPGCQQFIIVFAFVCVRMDERVSSVSGLKPKPNRCKQIPVRRGDCHLFDVPCSVCVCVCI